MALSTAVFGGGEYSPAAKQGDMTCEDSIFEGCGPAAIRSTEKQLALPAMEILHLRKMFAELRGIKCA